MREKHSSKTKTGREFLSLLPTVIIVIYFASLRVVELNSAVGVRIQQAKEDSGVLNFNELALQRKLYSVF